MLRNSLALILSVVTISGCSEPIDANSFDPLQEGSPHAGITDAFPGLSGTEDGGESTASAWIPRAEIGNDLGVHFEGEKPEMLTWGPKNFAIDADGTYWVSDTVVDHILHTDHDGTILETIDVSGDAVGAVMVDTNAVELAVISVASQPPRALRYSRSGDFLAAYDLPMEWQGSVTGIEISDAGTITVQREHGYRRYDIVTDAEGVHVLSDVPGITWDLEAPSVFDRFVVFPVDARNRITLRRFMGEWDGDTYVYVEEWRDDEYGRAVVDSTIRMFDENAEQIGIARVDIRDRYTFVDLGGVQYDPATGDMLAMMTKQDGLAIVPIDFVDGLEPLPDWDKPDDIVSYDGESPDTEGTSVLGVTCVSWATMWSNTGDMSINAYGSSTTDTWNVYTNSSTCSSRTVPRYMAGESFFGVPYSWGDWDNGSLFDSYMDTANSTNKYKAGDANGDYTSPTSCGRGTDCSGLVSRAWGLSSKIATSSGGSPGIDSSTYTTVDTGSWNSGEVYNLSGSHVVMYYGAASGSNYYWHESTLDSSYDRVVLSTHPMSYFSSYTHRRYVSQC